jgi:intracellular sulfur oxidation DsrE/DsrF family protein
VGRLLEAGADLERITLLSDIDSVWLLTEDAAAADDVVELLNDGVRVATNRDCLAARDIPIEAVVDDVVVLENSTLELVRLQDSGASIVTVP